MKKICIAAIGTGGDVKPMIALANILVENNTVTMMAPPDQTELCRQNRLEHYPIGDDYAKVAGSRDLAYFRKQVEAQFTEHHPIYQNADVIVGAGLFYAGRSLAEAFSKPYYHLFYTPQVLKSTEYAPAGFHKPFRGPMHNRLLWLKSIGENDLVLKKVINDKRKSMGLEPVRSVYRHLIDQPDTIIALDDRIAEIPKQYQPYIRQIRTLRYEESAPLSEPLRVFLDRGKMPVLVNFGSAEYTAKAFQKLQKRTIDAVRSLGYRVLATSQAGMDDFAHDDNVFCSGYAPHPALLPRVAAIIHHGGIGTVCASLKYAVPQIIVPQGMDQYFWAETIDRRKWGKAIDSDDRSFSSSMCDALKAVETDVEIRRSIVEISDWLNSEQYREENLRMLRKAMPACFS